jgi:cytochrome c oxidase accessory protein FixG
MITGETEQTQPRHAASDGEVAVGKLASHFAPGTPRGGVRTAKPVFRPTLETASTIRPDGSRRFVQPADVRGRFTIARKWTGILLLLIYVALPWIPINGNPAVFLDLPNRQFHFFGLTFVTQDVWLAFFLISGLGFALFYVTALLGRIWCGWACPQTVFLDIVRRIERVIEGDSRARHRIDAQGGSMRRFIARLAYGVFAFLLAHLFLAYSVSIPRVYEMMGHSPGENWGAFVFVFAVTGALWFDFAWFREQFCIVMCPYGRLQSALIDNDSLVIGYDPGRGEPRGKKGTPGAGDCVDCRRCVQVCPTGIDIRQGLQMECIGCTSCVDACDAVMDKIGRPRGLIRYDSMHGLAGKTRRILRPRIFLYTALLLLGAAAMTLGLATLKPATVSLTRVTGIPYVVESGVVRNQFILRMLNKRNAAVSYRVQIVSAPSSLQFSGVEGGIELQPLGEAQRTVVVTIPQADLKKELPLEFRITSADGSTVLEKRATFVGPIAP